MKNTTVMINEKGKNKWFYHFNNQIYTIESPIETNSHFIANVYDRNPNLNKTRLGKFDENLNWVWSHSHKNKKGK